MTKVHLKSLFCRTWKIPDHSKCQMRRGKKHSWRGLAPDSLQEPCAASAPLCPPRRQARFHARTERLGTARAGGEPCPVSFSSRTNSKRVQHVHSPDGIEAALPRDVISSSGYHSITESQHGGGWKGPLGVTQSNSPAEAGSPRAGCTAPRPGGA